VIAGRVQPVDDDIGAHRGGGHVGAALVAAQGPAGGGKGFGRVMADLAGLTAHEAPRQTPRIRHVWDMLAEGLRPLIT